MFQLLESKVDTKFEENEQIFKDDIRSLKEYIDKVFATKADLEKVIGQLLVIKWMLGVILAGIISLLIKTFF